MYVCDVSISDFLMYKADLGVELQASLVCAVTK